MPKLLKYKEYRGDFEIDIEANILVGKVLGLSDSITFEGSTPEELEKSFHSSVDAYLEFCSNVGKKPEKPFSGKLAYRTDPETHHKIFLAACYAGISINKWIDETLKSAVREENHENLFSV
jgi:predicted HicB family RNase H-like nuclease